MDFCYVRAYRWHFEGPNEDEEVEETKKKNGEHRKLFANREQRY